MNWNTITDQRAGFARAHMGKLNTLRSWAKKNKCHIEITRDSKDNFSGEIVIPLRTNRDEQCALYDAAMATIRELRVEEASYITRH
jgi:hypothetical protein